MPNSKLPIQRASSTWLASASSALATRTRKTFPAKSCASLESLRSPRMALMRAMRRAAAEGGATATFSDSASATGSLRAGDGRFASGNIPAA